MLFPAVTGLGLAVLVTLRSACVPDATPICIVAVLSVWLESRVALAAVMVSVMTVPAVTRYLAVMVPMDPGGTLGFVQETGAMLGQVQVPPPEVTTATETKVVLAGVASVNVALLQLEGPLLVTVCV